MASDAARHRVGLDSIAPGVVAACQPYRSLQAHLLAGLGRAVAAVEAHARAIGLSEDPVVRDFLGGRAHEDG